MSTTDTVRTERAYRGAYVVMKGDEHLGDILKRGRRWHARDQWAYEACACRVRRERVLPTLKEAAAWLDSFEGGDHVCGEFYGPEFDLPPSSLTLDPEGA